MSTGVDRKNQFKNKGKDSDSLRRQRSDVTVELRKKKKDDQLFKRRNVNVAEILNISDSTDISQIPSQSHISMFEIVEGVRSEDRDVQLKFTQAARKILSRENNPPIDFVIDAGIVPRLVEFLSHNEFPSLQLEAAWALTNIASGTSAQTYEVVRAGAIVPFIQLLYSPYDNLAEQAVWALGNIAGDGPELRDLVIKSGIVEPLLKLIRPNSPTLMRNIAWTLSNLCRNKKPSPPFHAIKQLLPALSRLLSHVDVEVVTDACWAFSYLSDGTDDKIAECVACNIIPQVVELLHSSDGSLLTPSLRIIGNIVTGTEEQTQMVIDHGALLAFPRLLAHSKPNIQKEAAWTISNILAGSPKQIEAVINAQLLKPLVEVLDKGDFKVQKEATFAVTNMTSGGTAEQIAVLVSNDVIPPLCKMLTVNDTKTILIALDALYNILSVSKKCKEESSVCLLIEECEGLDKIEELQEHENQNIYSASYKIIDEFFTEENEDVLTEDLNSNQNGEFKFGDSTQTHFEF